MKLARKKTILSKIESSYGVDPTPAGTNAVHAIDAELNFYEGERVDLPVAGGNLGSRKSINTGPFRVLTFDVPFAASGAAGTAPAYGPLLRACGYSETISAGVSVAYQPVSASYESVAHYFYLDGDLHKMLGSRGDVQIALSKAGLPVWRFRFLGTYVTPTAATPTSPDYSAFVDPVAVNKANTTMAFDSHAACMESLNFNSGNEVIARNVPNCESILIVDRLSTAEMVIEAPELATKNYFTDLESHAGITLVDMQVVHGTTAGNIITIDHPKAQVVGLSDTPVDKITHYSLNLSLTPNSGDDETVFTFT